MRETKLLKGFSLSFSYNNNFYYFECGLVRAIFAYFFGWYALNKMVVKHKGIFGTYFIPLKGGVVNERD